MRNYILFNLLFTAVMQLLFYKQLSHSGQLLDKSTCIVFQCVKSIFYSYLSCQCIGLRSGKQLTHRRQLYAAVSFVSSNFLN